MTTPTSEELLRGRLLGALDIIAAAEMQFAQTDDHHRYYGDIHKAVEEAADKLEELRLLNERMSWRPIETAPKDGTHILLWDNCGVRQGRYITDACRWFELNADWTDSWDGEIYQPSRWMPLPEPPSQALKDGGGG